MSARSTCLSPVVLKSAMQMHDGPAVPNCGGKDVRRAQASRLAVLASMGIPRTAFFPVLFLGRGGLLDQCTGSGGEGVVHSPHIQLFSSRLITG